MKVKSSIKTTLASLLVMISGLIIGTQLRSLLAVKRKVKPAEKEVEQQPAQSQSGFQEIGNTDVNTFALVKPVDIAHGFVPLFQKGEETIYVSALAVMRNHYVMHRYGEIGGILCGYDKNGTAVAILIPYM